MKKNSPLKKFYKIYLSKHKLKLIFAIAFAIIGGILLAYGPKIIGNLTTIIYKEIVKKIYGIGGIDYNNIFNTLIHVFYIYAFAIILIISEGWIITNVIQNSLKNLKDNIIKKITKLKISYTDDISNNSNITSIYNETDSLNQYFNFIFSNVIVIFAIAVGSLYFMIKINIILTLITLLLFPSLALMIEIVTHIYNKKVKRNKDIINELDERTEETINNYKLINIFGCKSKKISNYKSISFKAKHSNNTIKRTTLNTSAYSAFIGDINFVLIFALGIYLYNSKMIDLGDIQSFILYSKLIERPISLFSEVSNMFFAISESLNKIYEFLEIDEEKKYGNKKVSIGDIEFNNICFGYNDEKTILNNINLKIDCGQKLAIVGRTGSGKSTLVKLLLRFYDSYKGDIYINKTNIKEIELDSLRKSIGIVSQQLWLFDGTIKENILYGNQNSTEEDVINAAKKVGIHEYIEALPKKYDTLINENNTNLSSGHKQLICIARLILKNPSIVILDEATNMLDYETEDKIKNVLNKFLKDKTCIIVAHRLSTIQDCDKIIVIENGEIIEEGTHKELIRNHKKYYELCREIS